MLPILGTIGKEFILSNLTFLVEWGAISGGLGPSGIDGPNIWARAGFGLPKIIKIRARADFGLCFLKNVGLGPSRASKKREKPVGLSGSGKLDPSLTNIEMQFLCNIIFYVLNICGECSREVLRSAMTL